MHFDTPFGVSFDSIWSTRLFTLSRPQSVMFLLMMLRAKPPNIERFVVVIMMPVYLFFSAYLARHSFYESFLHCEL